MGLAWCGSFDRLRTNGFWGVDGCLRELSVACGYTPHTVRPELVEGRCAGLWAWSGAFAPENVPFGREVGGAESWRGAGPSTGSGRTGLGVDGCLGELSVACDTGAHAHASRISFSTPFARFRNRRASETEMS